MKIGLVQNNILWQKKCFNLNSSKSIFSSANSSEIDLLLFPEMSFTGFSMDVDKIKDSDSETIKYISSLCKTYSINAGIGYVTDGSDESLGRNNYAIISSDGTLLCNYVKTHPFSYAKENIHYEKGNEIVFCKIKDSIISPFICYDLRFPEIFQAASKKANLITVASNWPASRKEQWLTLLRARAIENQCFIAGINRVGYGGNVIYSGNSAVINPNGDIMAYGEDGTEDIVICDINTSAFKLDFITKNDRREDFYRQFY